MTINEDVPGIQVTVQIRDTEAVEYAADDATNEDAVCPTVTKYIECIDDASFRVRVVIDDNYEWGYKNHSLAYHLYIDGKHVSGHVTGYKNRKLTSTGAFEHACVFRDRQDYDGVHDQWVRRKFKFSSVKTGICPLATDLPISISISLT
jgi:hypothetical protein